MECSAADGVRVPPLVRAHFRCTRVYPLRHGVAEAAVHRNDKCVGAFSEQLVERSSSDGAAKKIVRVQRSERRGKAVSDDLYRGHRVPSIEIDVQEPRISALAAAYQRSPMPMIVSDAHKHDMPIVYATEAFCRLTGYEFSELVGRNCRLMPGPKTDRASVRAMRDAIERGEALSIDLLNYRKDGTTFWNALYWTPLPDSQGAARYYVGAQFDASARMRQVGILNDEKCALEEEIKLQSERSGLDRDALERALDEKLCCSTNSITASRTISR